MKRSPPLYGLPEPTRYLPGASLWMEAAAGVCIAVVLALFALAWADRAFAPDLDPQRVDFREIAAAPVTVERTRARALRQAEQAYFDKVAERVGHKEPAPPGPM